MKLPGMPDLPNMDGLVSRAEVLTQTTTEQLPRFVDAFVGMASALSRIADALDKMAYVQAGGQDV